MATDILTIDDSTVIRKIIKQAFSDYHCSVFEGANGQEGLELAIRVKPDLIFLDIDMPVMNGWDTLASLRFADELKDTPVIMLTANAQEKKHQARRGAEGGRLCEKNLSDGRHYPLCRDRNRYLGQVDGKLDLNATNCTADGMVIVPPTD